MKKPNKISKELSRNDTGETKAHQAGICIPKEKEILAFFPSVDSESKNPRHMITFTDNFGDKWTFSFIYYNNKFFGGTRNEYRLTRMTPFIKRHNLHSGDEIILARDEDGFYSVSFEQKKNLKRTQEGRLLLGSSWKVIAI